MARLPAPTLRWLILSQIPIGVLLLLVDLRRDRAEWNARSAWQKEQLRLGRERARRRELEARGFVADDGGGAGERGSGGRGGELVVCGCVG